MKRSFVDKVAFALPSLGSLIPAVLIFRNAQTNLKFEWWEAGVTAVVMEGLGFSSIATALDIFEQLQAEGKRWSGQLGVAVGGVVLYLAVGLLINALLDTGDWLRRVTLGLLTLLPIIGGLSVVLRNQLQKRQAALVQEDVDARASEAEERDYQRKLQQDEIAFQNKLKEQAIHLEHDLKVQKLQQKVSASSPKVANDPVQVAAAHNQPPETFGKWRSWAELPDEQRLRVAETARQARATNEKTYKKVTAKWVMDNFDVKERSAYEWIKYAERDYSDLIGGVQ